MDYFGDLLTAYRDKGLLLDSNVLLLLIVGGCDRSRIVGFERTAMFTEAEFDLLVNIVGRFKTVVTTPHILTEVSNLLGELPKDFHDAYFLFFGGIVPMLDEHYTRSRELAWRDSLPKFGLTDTAIIEDSRDKYLVLTSDARLYGYLVGLGIDAINFNHIRGPDLIS